jgi:DNA-dependent protein kinase catalytic subunit
MAWDTVPRVKFSVPFHDIKPEIFLDPILPRVVELAQTATERQTKLAACELLHSIVLFMVGSNAHSPRRDDSGPVRCIIT